ncbi:MAG: sigma 54-interacting transcriptional regulator [Deltaproteobacteria bacterium]|jgi:transcriptional regulator with PAS, ATPase and Fis domain|nr:sigma 54-interacting transcriptional regulator [Deltaproteobacteria bacterium]
MSDISKAFKENNLTSELLNALPCGILIITENGAVVKLNNTIENLFGVKNAEVIGKGFGKALCCINSCDVPVECGSDDGCKVCEVRKLALMALYNNEKKRRRVSLQVNIDRHIKDVTFMLCAAPFKFKRDRLSILTIEDITNLKPILPPPNTEGLHGFVCQDKKMKALCETVKQIAQTDAPILIQGESGTGKELVAQAIHKESRRTHKRFVTVNCGALPEGLLESELFGHVKGAFTGALYNKKGRFELADGGTIFLDEVAELNPEMQVKFLRVLQDGGFEYVGATQTQRVDVRVISATNVDLERAVADGKFRRDLYYRLCVMPVTIPPLRERGADIELLAKHFLQEFGRESYRTNVKLSHQTLSIFKKYNWPGNCREMQNVIQYALVKCQGDTIDAENLPVTLFSSGLNEFVRHRREPKIDEQAVLAALQKTGGNKRQAAEILGVSRSTLYRFFDRHRQQS